MGVVRELITKVKIQVDKASQSQANKALQDIKKQANDISKPTKLSIVANAGGATAVLTRLKSQLNGLGGKVTTTYVEVKQKGAAVGAGVKKAGKALADNGGTIAATGAAMTAPLVLPIKTAADFEAAMSKVSAITNATDADMERLTATARELGKSTQFSATEAAQAMSYLGMAGWKTDQIIEGMPGLLSLAAASGEDLARVADIVSDDLTAFHMSADQAAHMADVMAAASTNANTNVSMMGETFKYAGGIAGSLGYSLEDVALATGLMANAGIKGEMAGTALRSIMTRLVTPTGEASLALEQVGFSAKNADGSIKPFRDQLKALRAAMRNMTDAEKAEFAQTVAGTEAMTGFLDVINASDADFNKMTTAVDNSNGAAAEMEKRMNANAKGALKALKSAMEDLSITIGNVFLQGLTDAMKGLTDFARKVGEFANEHPKVVAAITGIVAAVGGLLTVLGVAGLAISVISTAIGAIAPVFSAIGGAITTVLSVGLAPLLAILGAIAAVIYFVGENWDTVVSWFQPGIDSIMEGIHSLEEAWTNLQPFIAAIIPLLQFIATVIGGAIVGAISLLFRVAAWVFNQIAGFINWVTGLLGGFGDIIQWCADLLSGLIDKALKFIGMKNDIAGVNTSITQGWADKAMASGSTNNVTQNNNYVFDTPQLYAPVARNNWEQITDFQ